MANVEMLLIPSGLVFTLRIKSAEICGNLRNLRIQFFQFWDGF